MVSNARLDLPDPERPVTTISRSRGNSTEMFFRLWTRAPCTAMVVRGAALPGIRDLAAAEKRQFLHLRGAVPGESHGQRHLGDEAAVRQVFAHARGPRNA